MKSVALMTIFAFYATVTGVSASAATVTKQASLKPNQIAQKYPGWAPKCKSWWDAINCAKVGWWVYERSNPCFENNNYACRNPNERIPTNDNKNQYGQTEVCDYNGRCTSIQNRSY